MSPAKPELPPGWAFNRTEVRQGSNVPGSLTYYFTGEIEGITCWATVPTSHTIPVPPSSMYWDRIIERVNHEIHGLKRRHNFKEDFR